MGRPKRKSDGDYPPPKKQLRKAEQQDEEASSGDAENESSDHLFVTDRQTKARHVKKAELKSRKSEPVKRVEQSGVPEEDGEMIESQQFFQLVAKKQREKTQAARAAAEFMENFNSAVVEDEKNMKSQVEKLSKESTKRDMDFLESFQDAFMTSRPKAPPAKDSTRGKSTPSTMAFASLYKRSRQLTSNASAIIQKFEDANEMTAKIELSDLINVQARETATDELQNVIDCGYRVGIERYQSMLAGDGSGSGHAEEAEPVTAEMFYPAAQYEASVGWGVIAKKVEKRARKLVKSLPLRVGR